MVEVNFIDVILFMGGWCVLKDNIVLMFLDLMFWYEKVVCMGSVEGMMRLG